MMSHFTVNYTPSSATNTTPTSAVCEGTDVTLAGTGTPTVEAGSGTISSGDYVTGNISSDETVTIRYTVSANGACSGSTADQSFTVNAAPSSATNTTPTSAVCEGTDVTLADRYSNCRSLHHRPRIRHRLRQYVRVLM